MEYCYKLNVPDFLDICKEGWEQNLTYDGLNKLPVLIPSELVLKKEFLTFNNYDWSTVIRFPLLPFDKTDIHSDNYDSTIDENCENPKFILFTINYLVKGTGRIDYYLPSQLESYYFDPDNPYKQKNWITKQNPYKSYEMSHGAYLLNVTIPHKVTAYEERLVISIRPSLIPGKGFEKYNKKTWEDIVNSFDNYIIK